MRWSLDDELSLFDNAGIETIGKYSWGFQGKFNCLDKVASLMNSLITDDRTHFVESLWFM